jgi:hypothetical protein
MEHNAAQNFKNGRFATRRVTVEILLMMGIKPREQSDTPVNFQAVIASAATAFAPRSSVVSPL